MYIKKSKNWIPNGIQTHSWKPSSVRRNKSYLLPTGLTAPGSPRIIQTLTSIKYQGLVCSRFSDSVDDAKVKGTAKILARDLRKVGGGERESRPSSPQFPPVLFSRSRSYSDIGIPIPKAIVIWASPSHITSAIWVRVRVKGMPTSIGFREWGCPYHCGSAFSISRTRLSRSLEWLAVTLTICYRVHIFDTFSCGNKAVLILPRGQDRPVLPDRVANRICSFFLPRGASRTIYYNYRIIKVACVQTPPPSSQ